MADAFVIRVCGTNAVRKLSPTVKKQPMVEQPLTAVTKCLVPNRWEDLNYCINFDSDFGAGVLMFADSHFSKRYLIPAF